jgi:hypothetical protein
VAHGVKGLFEQGNYSPGGFGEMGPLRAYLLAKLLWNPDTNLRQHQDEFLSAYYGKAADSIRAYLELLHRQVRDGKTHAHIFDPPTAGYLKPEFLSEADTLLAQAEKAAEDDAVRFRVQVGGCGCMCNGDQARRRRRPRRAAQAVSRNCAQDRHQPYQRRANAGSVGEEDGGGMMWSGSGGGAGPGPGFACAPSAGWMPGWGLDFWVAGRVA